MLPEHYEDVAAQLVTKEGKKVEVVEAKVVQEEPKDFWVANGFLPEIARVINDLEGERERFLLPSDLRRIIETTLNARTVEDFNRYSDDEIRGFKDTIMSRMPNIEREVVSFISQLTRARSVVVESIDFI